MALRVFTLLYTRQQFPPPKRCHPLLTGSSPTPHPSPPHPTGPWGGSSWRRFWSCCDRLLPLCLRVPFLVHLVPPRLSCHSLQPARAPPFQSQPPASLLWHSPDLDMAFLIGFCVSFLLLSLPFVKMRQEFGPVQRCIPNTWLSASHSIGTE